ncbi:hypothetical protein KKD70_01720, partial [Patescibacteria group bacterium]|nr:hypothetical protein [Patescibacteria group bacterium]
IFSIPNNQVDPFACNPDRVSTNHTFMAMRSIGGLSPVQFEASQMADLNNEEPGRIVFGEEVLADYERGMLRHVIKRTCGRTSHFIKNVIFGGKI